MGEPNPTTDDNEGIPADVQNEPAHVRSSRLRSIYIVHSAMLIFSLGFSIVLTGVYPYLKQLTPDADQNDLLFKYGWIVAANPLGQLLFSPVFGWLTNRLRSIRMVCIITSIAYIAGNVLYATLSLFPNKGDTRFWLMIVSRFVIGAASANAAPIRSYISSATYTHERTTHVSLISMFQSLGFIIGPGIQAALVPLKCADPNPDKDTYLAIDMFTMAGWLSAAIGVISLILFLPGIFTEHDVQRHHAQAISGSTGVSSGRIKPDYLAAFVSLFNFFLFLFNFVLLETLGTPLCMDQFAWTEEETIKWLGICMSIGGVLSVICYGSVGFIAKKLDERTILIFFGLIPMIVGRVVMIPFGGDPPLIKNSTESGNDSLAAYYVREMPEYRYFVPEPNLASTRNTECDKENLGVGCSLDWCHDTPAITVLQFFGGFAIACIGYPYCIATTHSIFSKVLGPYPQGLWMGALTAAGSLARVLGPLFVSNIYDKYGTYWTFGSVTGSMLFSAVMTLLAYRRLVPMDTGIRPQENEEENSKL